MGCLLFLQQAWDRFSGSCVADTYHQICRQHCAPVNWLSQRPWREQNENHEEAGYSYKQNHQQVHLAEKVWAEFWIISLWKPPVENLQSHGERHGVTKCQSSCRHRGRQVVSQFLHFHLKRKGLRQVLQILNVSWGGEDRVGRAYEQMVSYSGMVHESHTAKQSYSRKTVLGVHPSEIRMFASVACKNTQ